MSKPVRIEIDPYIRNNYDEGVAVWGDFAFSPWIARQLGKKLLAAADRLDPHRQGLSPWHEKQAAEAARKKG